MPIRVKCESCKKTLNVKDHLAGKKIKCPVCQGVVAVPTASAAGPQPTNPKTPAPQGDAAPKAKSPPAGAAKKPASETKAASPKTTAEKKPNGTPPANGSLGNGAAPKKPEPPPIELPPENVEDEALAAFTDEPPPPEDEGPPATIDFTCSFCEAELHFPLDQAGKQVQCQNAECRRILKVPIPKIEGKKDWRKMDRRGPAAAIVNQPEELENAWGTETTTRARQDSLAQAGAVATPAKPSVGAFGWMRRIFIVVCVFSVGGAAVYGVLNLRKTTQQHQAIKEIKKALESADSKITDQLLKAEAHRALGLLYLHEPKGADESRRNFDASMMAINRKLQATDNDTTGKKDSVHLNEQLFLLDLALALPELGGNEDDVLAKKRQSWDEVRKQLNNVLIKISVPEVQVMAVRELSTRLIEQKDQTKLAIQLAGILSSKDANNKHPLTYRQHIALVFAKGDAAAKKTLPAEPDFKGKEALKADERVGYAEGYARTGEFEKALALAKAKGPASDRLDACLGVAYVALLEQKQTEAGQFLEEARQVMREKSTSPTSWQQLQIIQLAARLEDAGAVKDSIDKMTPSPYRLRARLELFLAKIDKGPPSADDLIDLELEDKTGVTLALAWSALARKNGATRDENRKLFASRTVPEGLSADTMAPLVDIGSYLGSKK